MILRIVKRLWQPAVVVLLAFLVAEYFLTDVPKVFIEEIATSKAQQVCRAKGMQHRVCDELSPQVEGPKYWGPTDGSDEYTGDWFVTFYPTNEDKIFVALNSAGEVLYVNNDGSMEYPYCPGKAGPCPPQCRNTDISDDGSACP